FSIPLPSGLSSFGFREKLGSGDIVRARREFYDAKARHPICDRPVLRAARNSKPETRKVATSSMKQTDVLIIGAGVAGLAAAEAYARRLEALRADHAAHARRRPRPIGGRVSEVASAHLGRGQTARERTGGGLRRRRARPREREGALDRRRAAARAARTRSVPTPVRIRRDRAMARVAPRPETVPDP